MTAFMITGGVTIVAQDGTASITLDEATNSITGNKSTSVLKIDNPDLTTNLAITFELGDLYPATVDYSNCVVVPANGTVFVQVAPNGYTGSVNVLMTAGGAGGCYIQPVAIVG